MWGAFWRWYERTYAFNLSVALGLFLLQIVHLVWLFGEVIWAYLTGTPLFVFAGLWETLIVLLDYTEIPALISVSLIYINELRKHMDISSIVYLVLLNSQWLHIFWITDEFVVTSFNAAGTILPLWLAWFAISIDYFEVPVMVDTGRKLLRALRVSSTV